MEGGCITDTKTLLGVMNSNILQNSGVTVVLENLLYICEEELEVLKKKEMIGRWNVNDIDLIITVDMNTIIMYKLKNGKCKEQPPVYWIIYTIYFINI